MREERIAELEETILENMRIKEQVIKSMEQKMQELHLVVSALLEEPYYRL